ncbi:MAG: DNA polymerase I [Pseudomonadota bacterium]|nr:DNA polymerase I [Pseudomonadota bacterium]
MAKENYLIVDASGYIYRAFHALPDLRTPDQFPTGAIFGFVRMLEKTIKRFDPKKIAIVFDPPSGHSWRNDIYDQYKANRDRMPDDLVQQIQPIKDIVKWMGLKQYELEGQEADDVIATLAKKTDHTVFIASADKDLMQLVNDRVNLIHPMTDALIDSEAVFDKFGVTPAQMLDYLSLVGDASDHIPGVPKVGPKTASKWLNTYGTVKNIIAHMDEITGKVGENLRGAIDQLHTAQKLIHLASDLEVTWDDTTPKKPDHKALYECFKTLHLRRFAQFHEDVLNSTGQEIKQFQNSQSLNVKVYQAKNMDTLKATWQKLKSVTSVSVLSAAPIQADLFSSPSKYIVSTEGAILIDSDIIKWRDVFEVMGEWLNEENHELICHDFKTQINEIEISNLSCQKIDTMLAYYMLASHLGGRFTIENAIEQYLSMSVESLKPEEMGVLTIQLASKLKNALMENDMFKLFKGVEMPLMSVLQVMEHNGVCVDPKELHKQSMDLGQEIDSIEQAVYTQVGHEFNLSSPKQLQTVLYDELQLPILQKTPKGQPSTSESALEQLAPNHDIAKFIMRHRSLNKLKNTYTDKLPLMIDKTTQRIHGQFNQAVTSTGRLSSSDPNLQNIPIRTHEGKMVRKAFIAEPGYQLICADYSQIELRIMAHFSQDEKLLTAFKENKDIHLATAAEVFGVENPTEAQRRSAKAINFGLIYGMSSFGLASQIGVSRQDAQAYMDIYFTRYPGVKAFMENTRKLAHEQGYVETILGRRLQVLGINDRNFNRRQAAERAAINAPMQGSAADIIKKAMIDLYTAPYKMVLQVHDELIFEVPEKQVQKAIDRIKLSMTNAVSLSVPLDVNIAFASNWLDAK